MVSRPARQPDASLPIISLLFALLLVWLLSATPSTAYAGSISVDSSGTNATISAPTSVKYKTSKSGNAMWNHGTFYVYFFEETKSVKTSMERVKGSDIDTMSARVSFKDGVSWAKVHVAAVSSSTSGNGGRNTRLKNAAGSNLPYSQYLDTSKQFYVWISDTGGTGGKISLRGTNKTTVYADGKVFKNAEAITVGSQHGASHYDQGASESRFYDVLNIPFRWTGKDADQVPYRAISSRGLGNNGKYHSFYRLSWKQYSNGTTYSGYSPYKLQHGVTSALNIWTSVNLASVGITLAPTYTDDTYATPTGFQYRNKDSFIACCLRTPKEQLKLDCDGGTLMHKSKTYTGESVNFLKSACKSKVNLPTSGFKIGSDGSKDGYKLSGYVWKSGTNRTKATSSKPKSSKPFISFDQSKPESVDTDSPIIELCNFWQIPAFGEGNMEFGDGGFLKAPTVANVTYKALWEALPFHIHYIVNGQEVKTEAVAYDTKYKLLSPPNGSSGWTAQKQDGTGVSTSGNMPAQDIYAYAQTASPSTVRYYIDGELAASFHIPFGDEPLATTYVDKSSGGIEFNNDGRWSVDDGTFTATYKEHYNVPDKIACSHYVDTSYYANGYTVRQGHWTINPENGKKQWVDTSYYVPGHWVYQGFYKHKYDEEDNYSSYNTETYSNYLGAPSNNHSGTWHGWFTDVKCTSKAAASYAFSEGDCLSFYSYTDHNVSYVINGKNSHSETRRYGETINPYSQDDKINEFGGELNRWYTGPGYADRASNSVSVGSDDLTFYGYTKHVIHFWMDSGTKVASSDDDFDSGSAGDDEDADDGKIDGDPEEATYCRYEMTARYGDQIDLPASAEVSAKVTRSGCEDWLLTNGIWHSDSHYSNRVSNTTCKGDATFYSYNNVKLTYGLSDYAEELEAKQTLLDSKGQQTHLDTFLPAPKLYRYGSTVDIEGDGAVHWITSAGFTRSAKSLKGGFLDKDASGKANKTLLLQRSTTVYKQWAQGLFDGVTAS